MVTYKIVIDGVCKTDGGIVTYIPNDPTLSEWREYQAWVANGNTADPA